jgi:hypothetical protein
MEGVIEFIWEAVPSLLVGQVPFLPFGVKVEPHHTTLEGRQGSTAQLDRAEHRTGADAQQPALLRRSGSWARLTAGVRLV